MGYDNQEEDNYTYTEHPSSNVNYNRWLRSQKSRCDALWAVLLLLAVGLAICCMLLGCVIVPDCPATAYNYDKCEHGRP